MLNGIKVVEMATYIAAPAAGAILHEWGADVIKIEPLSGCPMREFFGRGMEERFPDNPVFDLDNRGKRSLALNASEKPAQEIIHKLVQEADVFITNLRPKDLQRQNMDYATLSELNEKLVYASITGFGLQGEEKDKPGFDTVAFWARSGLAWIMARKGTTPNRLRTGIGDHTTGMSCAAGILASLLAVQRTGKGRLVESSLMRTGIYAGGSDLGIFLRYGRISTSKPREQEPSPLMNFFRTKDDKWFYLNARPNEPDWEDILAAAGCEELAKEERFNSVRSRREHGADLVGLLDEAFAQYDMAELGKRFGKHDVIWAQASDYTAVTEDKQAAATGAFVETPTQEGGTYKGVATPVRFHTPEGKEENPQPTACAPLIGEHGAEILQELGYSADDITQLREQKILGGRAPAA